MFVGSAREAMRAEIQEILDRYHARSGGTVSEALLLQELRDLKLTQTEVGELTDQRQTTVHLKLKLLQLSPEMREAVERGEVPYQEALKVLPKRRRRPRSSFVRTSQPPPGRRSNLREGPWGQEMAATLEAAFLGDSPTLLPAAVGRTLALQGKLNPGDKPEVRIVVALIRLRAYLAGADSDSAIQAVGRKIVSRFRTDRFAELVFLAAKADRERGVPVSELEYLLQLPE